MRHLAAVIVAALLLPLGALAAEDRATTKDAELLVHTAVAYLKKNGKEKAFPVFSDPKGPFTFRDLYIVVLDPKATVVAHGTQKHIIGKDYSIVKDADGKFFAKEMVELSKAQGKGWIEYKYENPTTHKIEQKVAYVERVGDMTVLCGAYRH